MTNIDVFPAGHSQLTSQIFTNLGVQAFLKCRPIDRIKQ
nr:MAG TPA: hypothetical protein [Caudoviricetes sp.]